MVRVSDLQRRALERRFRETGSSDDELTLLHARVRTGETLDWSSYSRLRALDRAGAVGYLQGLVQSGALSTERGALASYCDDPAPLRLWIERLPESAGHFLNLWASANRSHPRVRDLVTLAIWLLNPHEEDLVQHAEALVFERPRISKWVLQPLKTAIHWGALYALPEPGEADADLRLRPSSAKSG